MARPTKGAHVPEGRARHNPWTPAVRLPMEESNEVDEHQLVTGRRQGDAYAAALQEMAREDGAVLARAGNYVIALINEKAEGMYAPSESTGLVWREAAERANAHIEVAVADSADGRFVPGLDVTVGLFDDENAQRHRSVSVAPLSVPLRLQRPPAWQGPVHRAGRDRPPDVDASRSAQRKEVRLRGRGRIRWGLL